jgi:hypothetical protein
VSLVASEALPSANDASPPLAGPLELPLPQWTRASAVRATETLLYVAARQIMLCARPNDTPRLVSLVLGASGGGTQPGKERDVLAKLHTLHVPGLLGAAEREGVSRDRRLPGRRAAIIAGVGTDDDTLGISLTDPEDRTIYRFYRQDLFDNEYDGRPRQDAIRPAFSSCASMLAHVSALRPMGQDGKPEAVLERAGG